MRNIRADYGLSSLLAAIAFAGALTMFLIRARVGLTKLEFGDETEKFVAAVMIRHGMSLYKDIFANHGPLAYLLAWLTTFVTGTADFSQARLVVVALALAACAAVASSPALERFPFAFAHGTRSSPLFQAFRSRHVNVPKRQVESAIHRSGYSACADHAPGERTTGGRTQARVLAARLWAAALFLAPLSALWFVHPLHMLIYHALAGYLLTIVLAQLVLPAIAGARIGWWGAFASGASGVLAVAAAYPEAVAVACCIAAATVAVWGHGGWAPARRMLLALVVGMAAAAVPLSVWITIYADWTGLFVYHFYFNQVVYGHMIGFSPWDVLHGIVFSVAPAMRVHSFALAAGVFGLAGSWRSGVPGRASRVAGIALTGIAVLMLNPKGSPDFPDSAEMIASFALLAVALGARMGSSPGARMGSAPGGGLDAVGGALQAGLLTAALAFVVTGEVVARTAPISPHGMLRSQATNAVLRPDPNDVVAVEVRRLVRPGETFLALPFMAASYLNAQRLPASGDYYYLPFQAEYDRAPILGWEINLCGDIERVRPAVILMVDFPVGVWGPLSQYKPCVAQLLARDYTRLPTIPFLYERRDRVLAGG
jgi:hypothetical protein